MTVSARICALVGAVLIVSASSAALAQTPITVVTSNPSAIGNFPLHVAIGEGYFADEGLDVTVAAVNGSAAVLQSLAAGQAQIGNPGPGPLLAARSRGEDMVFVYNQFPKSIFGLVVPEDSKAQTPSDLKGLIIGVGTADGAEVAFTRGIMKKSNLTDGADYEFLAIGDGGTAIAAVMNREVSAYAAAVVDVAILNSRGIKLREITPADYLGYFGNGWATSREFLNSDPKVIEGFGRAIARATAFGLDPANRDKVLQHAAVGNPQELEDRDFASAILSVFQDRMVSVDTSRPFGYSPPEDWQKWHDSQVAAGVLSAPLADLKAAYTNDFVEAWNKGL